MPRERYTNPIENLRSYIMVHGGIDRHERLMDVEWVDQVIKAAKEVAAVVLVGEDNPLVHAIEALREELRA